MKINPIFDALAFLFHGGWITAVFWLLLAGSIVLAILNLKRDPYQKSGIHLWNGVARLCIGALWWQQSLWKLPPTYTDQPDGSGGLRYWMGEMAKYACTGAQQHFVSNVVLPHFYFFAPQVWASEVFIAISLILGIFSRLGAIVGALMAANLWLGLYRSPAEWPWTYFFLLLLQITFIVYPPGRSLGVDAVLRRSERSAHPGTQQRLIQVLS